MKKKESNFLYRAVELRDCYTGEVYTIIMLSNKHSVKDFQKEIYRAKEQVQDQIDRYGDDWTYISDAISNDFDWYELSTDDKYLEY